LDVSSTWVREYGNWRIRTFGSIAAGDRALVTQRQDRRDRDARLHIDSPFHIGVGYATLFDKAPSAFFATLDYEAFGVSVSYSPDVTFFTMFFGHRLNIRVKDIGLMPYIKFGISYTHTSIEPVEDDPTRFSIPINFFNLQGGLKITSTFIPGLFFDTRYLFTPFTFNREDMENPLRRMMLSFSLGYAFK
jgi:hypothetical protein